MSNISKSIFGVASAVIISGASLAPVAVMAWGDSAGGRPFYTLEQINSGILGDTITFNSISNGKIGHEANFVGAKLKVDSGTWSANEIAVEDGKVYTVRLYVHNNNPQGLNAIAENVRANFAIPNTISNSQTIIGYLRSSNATPDTYWDEVKLVSDENFTIEYVSGSAKYTNEIHTFSLSDKVVTSSDGVMLGYDSLDGRIPGCFKYDGQVTIDIKIKKDTTPVVSSKISKTVRIKGSDDKTWKESVEANVGDEVEFQIEYVNLSSEGVSAVFIRDNLPKNLQYVAGSTYLYNSNHQEGLHVTDENLTTTGINIGGYNPNGNAYVRFTAKVVDETLTCGKNKLVNWANVTVAGVTDKDDASVAVDKVCGPDEPETPEEPAEPEAPVVIVDTGATEIVTGALGAGAVVTTLGYYIASRKKLM